SVVGVNVSDANAALDAGFRNGLVHAIDAANKSRLAASRGPNQSGSVVRRHFQVDVIQRLTFAIPGIQALDLDSNAHKIMPLRTCRGELRTGQPRQRSRSEESARTIPPRPAGASHRRGNWRTHRSAEAVQPSVDRSAGSKIDFRRR